MPFRPTYPLETSRLRLRPLREDDLDALLDYYSIPEVHRFIPTTTMDAQMILDRIESGPWSWTTLEEEGDLVILGVELADTGTVVGDVMLRWASARNRCGEIGYVLNPRHEGHGYATEAAEELLRLAFSDMGLHRVVAHVNADNDRSLALAARLGMRREAHYLQSWLREDEWVDEIHLAILRSEWTERHNG